MKLVPAASAALLLLALAGCSSAAPEPLSTSTAPAASGEGACADAEVTVQVDFGTLGADRIRACAPAGPAVDALDAVGIVTEGTADYGDQVVCRVDDQPSPDVESCDTLPADGYWALWVRDAPDGEWAYAEEGVTTLQLEAGQGLGLVYTQGTDSTPPSD